VKIPKARAQLFKSARLLHRTSGQPYEVLAVVSARCGHCAQTTIQAARWCGQRLCCECLTCGWHRRVGLKAADPRRLEPVA